ncbi:hypothetical protein A4R63_08180 [Corynebacterium pseudotuberculosis]|nr:hypothetical protein A4R68_08430 [Corynebacterium pseudotuberculosis]APB17581.1 hypothetical protein A4R67_08405 [Corynebacterium pseudotuberculosis]APB19629.1 hypothetical protein A4R66_08405 [Corynebacterium pseudotuberculosis]APB21670.1 hypothetical protein A4R65_08400 [Corynebacterium pseudotuberculosis]APB23680.1 hypothetical protein A4R64_08200 [Corynebacterium pseudotuberculosis]
MSERPTEGGAKNHIATRLHPTSTAVQYPDDSTTQLTKEITISQVKKSFSELREFYALEGKCLCKTCFDVIDFDVFPNDKNGNRGKAGECQSCQNERQRNRSRKHFGMQGRLDSGKKRFRRNHKRVYSFTPEELEKYMTKKRRADIKRCYYTGIPLQTGNPADASTFLELDHVKPMSAKRSTHSVSNVVPATKAFNQYKRDKRAVEAVLTAPDEEGLRATQCYVGLAEGVCGVDIYGNPTAPAIIEGWSKGDSPAITIFIPEDEAGGGDQ